MTEAALGTTVSVPTPEGPFEVELTSGSQPGAGSRRARPRNAVARDRASWRPARPRRRPRPHETQRRAACRGLAPRERAGHRGVPRRRRRVPGAVEERLPVSDPGRRSALVVIAREAEPVVGTWRLRFLRESVERGIPPGLILFPFVPAAEIDDGVLVSCSAGCTPRCVRSPTSWPRSRPFPMRHGSPHGPSSPSSSSRGRARRSPTTRRTATRTTCRFRTARWVSTTTPSASRRWSPASGAAAAEPADPLSCRRGLTRQRARGRDVDHPRRVSVRRVVVTPLWRVSVRARGDDAEPLRARLLALAPEGSRSWIRRVVSSSPRTSRPTASPSFARRFPMRPCLRSTTGREERGAPSTARWWSVACGSARPGSDHPTRVARS